MSTTKYLSSEILIEVLSRAMNEERLALTRVLHEGATIATGPHQLHDEISVYAGNAIGNFLRGGGGVSYSAVLFSAAKHLKIEKVNSRHLPMHDGLSLAELERLSSEKAGLIEPSVRFTLVNCYVDDLERKILAQLMLVAYGKATPEQRAVVDAKLAELARTPEGKRLSGLSASAALLVLGNLGGFATYTLMSTVLSTFSMGALGFGAYTLASSLLSVVLGPAGWLSLAAYGVFKLGSPNSGKVVQLVATCAMISQRIRG